jgi:hypothetical protein
MTTNELLQISVAAISRANKVSVDGSTFNISVNPSQDKDSDEVSPQLLGTKMLILTRS